MVLVTGATGILGSLIVLKLLQQEQEVRATKRCGSQVEKLKDIFSFYTDKADYYYQKIEWVEVDFEDLDSLRVALEGVKQVYHTAAKVSFHPRDKKSMYKTNIQGTKNLLYIAEEKTVEQFLYVSSIAVLDAANEFEAIDEESNFNPKLAHSSYAISKHFSEMEVWRASAEGMNVVVINPGVIIGSGNWEQSSGVLFDNIKKLPFSFKGSTGYVDVRDVADIAIKLFAEETKASGQRFILISENKTYIEVANLVRKRLGLSSAKIFPSYLWRLGCFLSKIIGWALPVLKLFNKANTDALNSKILISNEKIKSLLQYKFISVEESIDFHLKNWIKSRK
ncbi:NAD-dependent epimerase/dehydratase family protein [Riemerella anatipestifer]|uniref:NaD-dependent epimerase/dehydratase n=1 Tax=Riemerella anatipestifer (strain ATCC 11845 / DSM 15868 / JCM 9532 / NCTC 11014) TaxID=693978 RepID=E4T9Q6_RIEAD|nr:NAD-dependent epimerase/dehydratase family protein [Riemerella anatipestifer]ADQ81737.1 NAD-dependent epimerase/dehydratase [Riemerella anatipestifer ATCC 11845 = DSM 15868]ADZ12767.1 NAD-dependent epimerase/dehydratase [Riemerella anatipestifer RA-GD]AFD55747.1 naD-dependent epimerase/dehydratase [Riemerella anatipestifer ATCC 11845 = DSM 15868]AGC40354.1 hypothetical protein G148_1050 [Riemerella anatipestifer RA-CH-2]AKP68984.1 naD-dependent epimerase/dehydratase [Riemerella anatipestife